MKDLKNFKKNIYSQNGEDGIVQEIFYRLKDFVDYQYCEFGAWDGIYLSNVHALIKKKNSKALLIEPDKKKFIELCKNNPSPSIIKLNTFVGLKDKNKIDTLLKQNNFNINFDFLSIDVDSIDYYIFKSLNAVFVSLSFNSQYSSQFIYLNFSKNENKSARSMSNF